MVKLMGELLWVQHTSFSRICVYLDVSGAIPESTTLSYKDFEWLQTIDYKLIPFRCRKCHENGHLFYDYPLPQDSKPPPNKSPSDPEGFIPSPKARKPIPKNKGRETQFPQATNSNPFAVLE